MRAPTPRPPHRRADRRHRARVRSAAERAAQGHPRRLLLLPGAPRIQHQPAHRNGQGATRHSEWPAAPPDSTSTSTPSATTATDTALEKHYVPRRSQRTRAVLTFFAQDHASTEMVYANAEITKAEQAREILAFADYWRARHRRRPRTAAVRLPTDHLQGARRAHRARHRLAHPAPTRQHRTRPPRRATRQPWKTVTIARAGRYRRPQLHEDMIKLKDVDTKVRQIAIRNIGRDQPTLLITNDLTTPGKDLFARYAERMSIENELDAYISGFHLDALSSGVPLNVDLDTTLTVVAGNLYRLFARDLTRTRPPPPTPSGATSSVRRRPLPVAARRSPAARCRRRAPARPRSADPTSRAGSRRSPSCGTARSPG